MPVPAISTGMLIYDSAGSLLRYNIHTYTVMDITLAKQKIALVYNVAR